MQHLYVLLSKTAALRMSGLVREAASCGPLQAGFPKALRVVEHDGALHFAGEHTSVHQASLGGPAQGQLSFQRSLVVVEDNGSALPSTRSLNRPASLLR